MNFRLTILFLLLVGFLPIYGQQELLLSTQTDNLHAQLINPAYWPTDKKVIIGLPGLSIDGWHSGKVSYDDIIQTSGGKRTVNLNDLISKLEAQNQFQVNQRTETVCFGIKTGKHLRILGHHAIRIMSSVQYPKEMAQLLWQGNAQFIGETIRLNPSIDVSGFNELALGAAYQAGPISFGVRGKYLTGLGITKTERFNTSVYTNPDIYQLELQSDICLVSAGMVSAIDTTSKGFDVQFVEFKRDQLFTKNTGIGFDAGVQFEVTDKLSLALSAQDLGASIEWKNDVQRFTSRGNYTYEGLYFDGNTFFDQNGQINIDNQLDSLRSVFQFNTASATTKQTIPARLYANAMYQLSKKLDIGFAASTSKQADINLWGAGVSLGYKPIKQIKIGTILSSNDHANIQVGSLIDVRLGPARMYLAADNLVSAISPKGQTSVQVRYGFGLVF
jgi:Family of unknown function (DUF5723)